MKNLIILVVLLSQGILMAQFAPAYTCVTKKKNNVNRCPMIGSSSYVAILDGSIDKEALINATKEVLEAEAIEIKDNEIFEFDDNLKQIQLRLETKGGMYYGSVGYGMRVVQTPVLLNYDFNLTFNDENQMMIEFTNFDNDNLIVVNDKGEFAYNIEKISPPLHKKYTNFHADVEPKKEKEKPKGGSLFKMKIKLGKKGVKTETENNIKEELGLDDVFKKREKYRADLKEEFEVYENEVKDNPNVKWVSNAELAKYKWKGNKYYGDLINSAVASNEVVGVNVERFQDYFLKSFDFIIKHIARNTGSEISEIGLDGKKLYENVDGNILPVDPKERKKWIRKSIVY